MKKSLERLKTGCIHQKKTKSPVVISKWDIIAKKVAIYPEEINCRDIYVKKNFICPNKGRCGIYEFTFFRYIPLLKKYKIYFT